MKTITHIWYTRTVHEPFYDPKKRYTTTTSVIIFCHRYQCCTLLYYEAHTALIVMTTEPIPNAAPATDAQVDPKGKQFSIFALVQPLYIPIAATVAETSTHPIDFVKTQTQIRKSSYLACARETFAAGGVLGFYPSLFPAVVRHWIYTSSRVGIYERISDVSVGGKALAALAAGALAQFISNPMDLVKIQIINNPKNSIPDVVKSIYKLSGFKGFYTGWQPNVARSCLCNVAELVTYDMSKKFILKSFAFKESSYSHFFAAVISGAAATFASTPADFIKSNYMSGPAVYNHSVLRCCYTLVKDRGVFVLWTGSLLNFLRLGPWQTIFWVSYERLKMLNANQ